jgi:hypothetical protein
LFFDFGTVLIGEGNAKIFLMKGNDLESLLGNGFSRLRKKIRPDLSGLPVPIFWEFPNDLGFFFGKMIRK